MCVAAPRFDLASRSLTGFWRANGSTGYSIPAGTGTMLAVASAGASGSNGNLTEATYEPALGAALNGHVPPDYDGVSSRLAAGGTLGTFLTDGGPIGSWSVGILCNLDSFASDPGVGSRLLAPCLASDTAAYFIVAATTSGITLEMADGIGAASNVTASCSTGRHYVQVSYNGTTLWLRVDRGTPSTANYAALGGTGGTLRFGCSYDAAAVIAGQIFDISTMSAARSQTDFDNDLVYINGRYGLAL